MTTDSGRIDYLWSALTVTLHEHAEMLTALRYAAAQLKEAGAWTPECHRRIASLIGRVERRIAEDRGE